MFSNSLLSSGTFRYEAGSNCMYTSSLVLTLAGQLGWAAHSAAIVCRKKNLIPKTAIRNCPIQEIVDGEIRYHKGSKIRCAGMYRNTSYKLLCASPGAARRL